MTTMNDRIFDHILDGLKQSIERSRFATTLLMVACVLCAIAYWNGKENSWGRARMERYMVLAQLDSLVEKEKAKDPHLLGYRQYMLSKLGPKTLDTSALLTTQDSARFLNGIRKLRMQKMIPDSLYERLAVPYITTDFVDHLEDLNTITPGQAVSMRQAMTDLVDAASELPLARDGYEQTRRAYIRSTRNVDLPFFGLAFDLNDLALLSGLGFTLLLLALAYNLLREHHNLETVVDWVNCTPSSTAQERCMRIRTYQAAANFNVLTMPPQVMGCSTCKDAGSEQFKRTVRFTFLLVSKAIYVIPVILHATIRHNDIRTRAHGFALQPGRLSELEAQSTFFLVTIAVLTAVALVSATRIELLWVTFSDKVRPGPTDGPNPCAPSPSNPDPARPDPVN